MCPVSFGAAASSSDHAGERSNVPAMSDDPLTEPASIADGTLAVRDRPDLGVAIGPDELTRYRQDR